MRKSIVYDKFEKRLCPVCCIQTELEIVEEITEKRMGREYDHILHESISMCSLGNSVKINGKNMLLK